MNKYLEQLPAFYERLEALVTPHEKALMIELCDWLWRQELDEVNEESRGQEGEGYKNGGVNGNNSGSV